MGGWSERARRGRRRVRRRRGQVGFAQIVGHRIPDRVIDDMVAASDAFFALPLERKLAARPHDLTVNRGYAASGTEALSYSIGDAAPPDLFEAFNIGEDDVDEADPFYAAERHRMFAANIWPDEPAALRPALVAYFAEARRVALALTDVFAVALGLPEQWFRPFVDRSTTTMRTINYERRAGEADPLPDQQRMGAHTDYGVVTVLWADRTPGARDPGGRRALARRGARPGRAAGEPRRPDGRVDQRPLAIDAAPGGAAERARRGASPEHGVLLRRELGRPRRVRPHVHRRRPPAEVPARGRG